MKKIMIIRNTVIAFLFGLVVLSCSQDWLTDTIPSDKIDKNNAIKDIKDARNAVNGIFSVMQSPAYYGAGLIVYGDLKAMDVRPFSIGRRYSNLYFYSETADVSNYNYWVVPYFCLASINSGLENIDKLETKTVAEVLRKREIKANLYALRALNHFDLLRLYARIPAAVKDVSGRMGVVKADKVFSKNEKPGRGSLFECYSFVIEDLEKADKIMPDDAKTEGWFDKTAIEALLARVYLYNGNNEKAYELSKNIIEAQNYRLLEYDEYVESWRAKTANSEAILEIINTEEDNPNREGVGYLWSSTGYRSMSLTNSFVKLMKQNPQDIRLKLIDEMEENQVKYFLCRKYPDDLVNKIRIIRLSEVYFIGAEAALKIGKVAEATEFLNVLIEKRTKVANQLQPSELNIDKLLEEKRKEFFGEGHIFFDFVRNQKNIERNEDDLLLEAPQTIEYYYYKVIQPIPRVELDTNPNIVQNRAYES